MSNFNLVGMNLPHAHGSLTFTNTIPKNDWNDNFKNNKAIQTIYRAILHRTIFAQNEYNGDINVISPFVRLTNEYNKFINLFKNKFNCKNYTDHGGYFDMIDKYGYEIGKPGHPSLIPYGSEEIFIATFTDYSISFAPFKDGVWLVDISVNKNKRGKGIGTEVMNKIYDISEDSGIEIFLTPYPAEQFKSIKEKNLVDDLKNWYDKIGFAPISNNNKVWSNME